MIIVKGGVTTAKGFIANGVAAGIKKSGKKDLALIYSEPPAVAAGAFTTNRFEAAPVTLSKENIKGKKHQAIIVNSGNANCANGKTGYRDALIMTGLISEALSLNKKEVLIASTGIIGKKLPVDKVRANIAPLVAGLSKEGGASFSDSILTTDTVKKEFAVKIKLDRSIVTIGGCCKGVGMIYPYMKSAKHATMLAFITTDAVISKKMLESALDEAISDSFNMVSVDGDMSTNDSCFVLANGLAGNTVISARGAGYRKFTDALKFMSVQLARMMARDGEGATKFVEILVKGAKTKTDASVIARKISTSSLLKCAICGEDPNWGRIAAAAGSAGVKFDSALVDIYLGNMKVMSKGSSMKNFDKEKARSIFKEKDVKITIDLKVGRMSATAWTCDFSKEYVAINSEYST